MTGFVYFVSDGRAIKIGFSERPDKRLTGLQVNTPNTLTILATVPAAVMDELSVQRRFEHLRVRGEWFRMEPELLEFIEAVKQRKDLNVPPTVHDLRRAAHEIIEWSKPYRHDLPIKMRVAGTVRGLRELETRGEDAALRAQIRKNLAEFAEFLAGRRASVAP